MLCLQVPGTFLILYFLVFLSQENLSTWLAYLVSGIEQCILLGLVLYYDGSHHYERTGSILATAIALFLPKPVSIPCKPLVYSLQDPPEDEDDSLMVQENGRSPLLG